LGDKVDRQLLQRLEVSFSLDGRVDWMPSEKNKPPPHLEQRWEGLESNRDVTVCITGRIGHVASGKAASVSGSKGVVHLKVESAKKLKMHLSGTFVVLRDSDAIIAASVSAILKNESGAAQRST
jgi:hypothetical protein